MLNLKCRTRGDSTPNGKPRVYFCCHPLDFGKYFETIATEILEKQNCAIWYKEARDSVDEDLLQDLKQMQLFVMPVTTNLLCSSNVAIDVEFKFAIDNHIPVLPLMLESGLEEIFNKKCGELQFLDRHTADITAISYDEKLQKFLESVLIGDELAEKIRAAFDAYVFLSYRKKDRKYAQELMHLIHKNEFCRDIAIWYDEFLTPGENFNDSIRDALRKSDLFVLAVTPNIVNESNYIMTTEYPLAKQEGKPILSAELLPTDRRMLAELYEDIPTPANAHNDAELSVALLESVKRIAIKENDNSPEHNFFIGLAYLGGVDVEVDYTKAVELITDSANNGLVDAQKKLVQMYLLGEAVDRNLREAVNWQKKVINYYYGLFFDTGSEVVAICIADEIKKLGDFIFAIPNYTHEATDILKKTVAFHKKCLDSFDSKSPWVLEFSIALHLMLAELTTQTEEFPYPSAKTLYDKAVKFSLLLPEDNIDTLKLLCKIRKQNGIYKMQTGSWSLARYDFEYFLNYAKIISAQTGEVGELIGAYCYLGDISRLTDTYALEDGVLLVKGDPINISENYYKLACDVGEKAEGEKESDSIKISLAKSYEGLGFLNRIKEKTKEAIAYYKKAIAIREKMLEINTQYGALKDQAEGYNELAILYLDMNALEEALACHYHCIELKKRMTEIVPDIDNFESLAKTYLLCSSYYGAEEKKVFLKEAYNIFSMLSSEHPDDESLRTRVGQVKSKIQEECI